MEKKQPFPFRKCIVYGAKNAPQAVRGDTTNHKQSTFLQMAHCKIGTQHSKWLSTAPLTDLAARPVAQQLKNH